MKYELHEKKEKRLENPDEAAVDDLIAKLRKRAEQ